MNKKVGLGTFLQSMQDLSQDSLQYMLDNHFITEITVSDLPVDFASEVLAQEFKKQLLDNMPERPSVTWINGTDSINAPVIKFAFKSAVEKEVAFNLLKSAANSKTSSYTIESRNCTNAYHDTCEQIDEQLHRTGLMTKIHLSLMPDNADLLRVKKDFQLLLYEVAPYLKFDLWQETAAKNDMKEWAFTFDKPVEISKFLPFIDAIARKEICFCGFDGEAWRLSILPGHISFPGIGPISRPAQP